MNENTGITAHQIQQLDELHKQAIAPIFGWWSGKHRAQAREEFLDITLSIWPDIKDILLLEHDD